MTKSILKTVLFGALMGAAIFFMPRLIIGMFIFFAIMRLFMFGRMRRYGHYQFAFADKIRGMSEEEYSQFKNHRMQNCGQCGNKNETTEVKNN